MNRQDVENTILLNVKDNTTKYVTPKRVRDAMGAILDWLEFLELGGTVADLDEIYRKLSDSYSKSEVNNAISAIALTPGPQGIQGIQGPRGIQGLPGKDGSPGAAGTNGQDGHTPNIGENGNWWINGTDTGIKAELSAFKTYYDDDIIGSRNVANSTFTLPAAYVSGTVKLWIDGLRQTPGNGNKDFQELSATDGTIIINSFVSTENKIIVEIQKK